MEKYNPEIVNFFEKKYIYHEFFSTDWILTLFSNSMEPKNLFICWNFMIFFGWKFFYSLVIQILRFYKRVIFHTNENGLNYLMKNLLKGKKFTEDLPNILRELPSDMEESKVNDLTTYLEITNCAFIKKLGKLLINEEKKKEEIKSALSLNSQETDVSLNINKNNGKEIINEITEKIINMGDGEKKFENKCDIEPMMYNENVNYFHSK